MSFLNLKDLYDFCYQDIEKVNDNDMMTQVVKILI